MPFAILISRSLSHTAWRIDCRHLSRRLALRSGVKTTTSAPTIVNSRADLPRKAEPGFAQHLEREYH
ncbi:MAG: hypothetical protein K0Q94_2791 [Paenibacillus sp.]|jgi:hypothetical protein|nr:hypothetical protein [Paenibacillus sp.]